MLSNAATIAVAGVGGVVGATGVTAGAVWRPPPLAGTAPAPTDVEVVGVGAVAVLPADTGGALVGEAVADSEGVGVAVDVGGMDVAAPAGVVACRGPDNCVGCVDGGGAAWVVEGPGALDDPVEPAEPSPVVGKLPAGVVDGGAVGVVGAELASPAGGVATGVDADSANGDVEVALVLVVAGFVVLSELEFEDAELTVSVGSAWAMPAPVISAAPNPTVMAEFVTHRGTSCPPGARCRPWPGLDALAARAFALARFFTR